ncbi:hypothetical protein MNBD_NITROSPINAE01-1650 [hydrothermal vent metagenome]|uniref:Light-independent protochlorophyllide reductase subunit B-like C-terminal domain-containing protein n=1 Tax=hydrothermal vent metagenome TaxID=652676 RepID=A0A3B1C8M9_9ZZZZ
MSDKIKWAVEAEDKLKKVPPFARDMAKSMIEDFVKDLGETEVTPELMKKARAKFGM